MKIAIAGAGTIVPGFLDAAVSVQGIEFVSIFARETSKEVMKKLKEHFKIKNIYHDYNQLLADDIDAVYIALPNHLHYDYAKKALEAGKHVFLEKPFVTNLKEAQDLIATAREHHCVVFEAIVNQHLPSYLHLREQLHHIGQPKLMQLNYSQYSRRYDQFKVGEIHAVFDPSKAGGALMDINVYNIHFVVGLYGKPLSVHYSANVEKGVDTSGILVMDYGSFKCVASGAKDSSSPSYFSIQGDLGTIYSSEVAARFKEYHLQNRTNEVETFSFEMEKNYMFYEVRQFKEIIEGNDQEKIQYFNQQALDVMEVLEAARLQILEEGI